MGPKKRKPSPSGEPPEHQGTTNKRRLTKKRTFHGNRHVSKEQAEAAASTSASKKKLKTNVDATIDKKRGYRIIEFLTFVTFLCENVKCKTCDGDISLSESSKRGLGFKVQLKCGNCCEKYVNSSPLIGDHAYEINRRSVLAMRLIGVGHAGLRIFCGVMDLPKPISDTFYDSIVSVIRNAAYRVVEWSMSLAAKEEKEETVQAGIFPDNQDAVACSGDGSWRKRGFTSLSGIASIIGHYTGKVIDIIVKNSYCKMCEYWDKRNTTDEYFEWIDEHISECNANHEGSSGLMEVNAVKEMFQRSEEKHNLKYLMYIGDGDAKTFNAVFDSNPYDPIPIQKKECVGHVQKRLGKRLRDLKKKTPGLGGQGRLTGKEMDKLQSYYGKAIRDNTDSVENMRKAILATLNHRASTDRKPQHQFCPPGKESWCKWQKAVANGELVTFKHKPALPPDVIKAITPIYKDLSKEELLTRCLGGFTQNANESLNAKIWKLAPKHSFSGLPTVEIAAYIATATFNNGNKIILKVMEEMGITPGIRALNMTKHEDELRLKGSDKRAQASTKTARQDLRRRRLDMEEAAAAEEGALYTPGGF